MKVETKIILTALRNFLDRPEVKDKKITAQMPVNPKLGNLSGKLVEIPLTSVFQGMTHKIGFADMAKVFDENNDVVCIFLEELSNELQDYVPPVEEPGVSIESKEKEVDDISKGLKGDSDESEQVEE